MRITPRRAAVAVALAAVAWAPPAAAGAAPPDTTPDGPPGTEVDVPIRIESLVGDVADEELRSFVLATLGDPRSWGAAGFRFRAADDAAYRVVLAEPAEVDRLCLPLRTNSAVSCQNGPVVALNAERWRRGPGEWDRSLEEYRRYMVNHEVGHLVGQRHPTPRCPAPGTPAAVMEQQTKGLEGCTGNPWPLWWELERAAERPAVLAPPPEWGPDPVPRNLGGAVTAPTTAVAATAPPPTTAPTPVSDPATASPAPPVDGAGGSAAGSPDARSDGAARAGGNPVGGRSGLVPTWLAVLGGVVVGTIGATMVVRRRRRTVPARMHGVASGPPPAWSVTVRQGASPVGRHDDVLWIVPPGWRAEAVADLVGRVAEDLARPEPGRLVRSLLASARPAGLADDEGLAVVVQRAGRARVLVLGTAEAVVEDGERRSRRRVSVVEVDRALGVDRFGVTVPPPGSPPAGAASSLLLVRDRPTPTPESAAPAVPTGA